MRRPMASKRAAFAAAAMVVSDRALFSIVAPMATPMRRTPKSKAMTISSCMPGDVRQVGKIDAEQLHRGRQAFLGRQLENDVRVGSDGQPGVLRQFPFELPGRPAGVAQ